MTHRDADHDATPGVPQEPTVATSDDPIPPTEEAVATWRARTFASLRNPNYLRFFAGQSISLTGTWMQSVAMAWLVLELTHSATWLGLVVALQFVPVLFLGPYAGVVVDRVDKRRLLVGTQVAAAVQALVLAALTISDTVTLAWVLLLSLCLGLINAFDNPGRQAFIREMVDADETRNAVSLNSVLVNVARAVGPAVAGVLIATVGVGACFLVNAVSFSAVIGAYLGMDRRRLHVSAPVARASRQVRDGFRYVARTPQLLFPLLMMAIVGTFTYEFQVVLPAFAVQTFDGGARSYGLITAAMGLGAVIGGLASAGRHATGIAPLVVAATVFGAADLVLAVAPTVEFAALALVAVGAGSVWFLSIGNSTLQMVADPQMRGRVMALWAVAFLGSTPLGGPIVGWVAEHAGPRWALTLGAAAALAAAVLGLVALRSLRRVRGEPA
jgi:MFS family permease